jgi:hypothetical protein
MVQVGNILGLYNMFGVIENLDGKKGCRVTLVSRIDAN